MKLKKLQPKTQKNYLVFNSHKFTRERKFDYEQGKGINFRRLTERHEFSDMDLDEVLKMTNDLRRKKDSNEEQDTELSKAA